MVGGTGGSCFFLDACGINGVSHQLREPVGREGFALLGQEQRALILAQGELVPHLVGVSPYPGQRPFTDGDHAVFLALALADHHRAALMVDVIDRQANEFHAPHAGAVEGLQHGAVAQAGGGADGFGACRFAQRRLARYTQWRFNSPRGRLLHLVS